jgi:hypothetical protein
LTSQNRSQRRPQRNTTETNDHSSRIHESGILWLPQDANTPLCSYAL